MCQINGGEQLINIVLKSLNVGIEYKLKNYEKILEYHCKIFSQTLSMSIVPLYFPPKVECIYIVCMYFNMTLYSAHWTDKNISWEYHIAVNVVRHNKLVQQLRSRTNLHCVNVCYLNIDRLCGWNTILLISSTVTLHT